MIVTKRRAVSIGLIVVLLAAPGVLRAASTAPRSESGTAGPRPRTEAVRTEIDALVQASGAEVSVAYKPLRGRDTLLIRADDTFHAASTMKVPVMIELYRQARAGRIALDEPIPVRNEFRSVVDGSPFTLSTSDDSDGEVYQAIGKTMTSRALVEAMITRSSNLAANILIDRLGAEHIQRTTNRLGAPGMHVRRGVEDDKAFVKGLNNETTARALMVLLDRIASGKAVDGKASAEMLATLKRQTFNDAIPAGLPPGTIVAHKTGNITAIHHDAAIVYGPRPYILVVLVRGITDEKVSAKLIADISKVVWEGNR